MTIGQRIKYERTNRNISLTDLANRIGISKQSLYKYETGIITNIPINNIAIIAKLLDVSPAYLMGWTEGEDIKQKIELTPDENDLISEYRTLNAAGKGKLREYASDLTTMDKYTISNTPFEHEDDTIKWAAYGGGRDDDTVYHT